MFDRILVPLDGSPVAATALGFATLIPSRTVALVRVAHPSADGSAVTAGDLDAAFAALAPAVAEAQRHGREVEPIATTGDPAEEILRAAEDADLIVMTTRGAGATRRAIFGSVADRIAHHAPVPVLLMRGDDRPTTEPLVVRLVVPLDGSDRTETALPFATDLAGDLGVGLHLLGIVEADPVRDAVRGGPLAFAAQSEAMERTLAGAKGYLDRLAQRARDGVGFASTGVRVGSPVAEIMAALRPGHLAVMSTHGRGAIGRWLHRMAAPVLLVPARPR